MSGVCGAQTKGEGTSWVFIVGDGLSIDLIF
jgi:hypothetical protein